MIRHAPVISDGLFYGSRDVACRCPNTQEAKKIRASLPNDFNLYVSSAKRCLTTANSLFPEMKAPAYDALRESKILEAGKVSRMKRSQILEHFRVKN